MSKFGNAEFTPEGWSVDGDDELRIVDVQDVTIAKVFAQPGDSENWAPGNARLIAQAPRMYEVLLRLTEVLEREGLGKIPQELYTEACGTLFAVESDE